MNKKQLQQMLVIIPIAFIAGVFAYYKYLILPLNERKKALRTELENIRSEFQESKGRAERLPKLEQEIFLLSQEIATMQKKLPPTKDVPGLIRLLSRRMEHYGVVWKRLAPGTQTAKDYYIEHSYTIPFTCIYHDLARFLTEIGQMERIFATKFTSLKPSVDSQTGIVTVSGELTFLIYTSN
jgi:type IV pilus assembly protein PilO